MSEWIRDDILRTADRIHGEYDYGRLEPVIQISIMGYSLFGDHRSFFARYALRDEEGYVYTDRLQFYVMDLTQTDNATEQQRRQGLVEWANAFKAQSWDEVNQIRDTGVREAARTMQLIMSNPTERELIRMRQDAQNDWVTSINSARREGTFNTLANLARKKLISIENAAKEADMTIEDFVSRAGL